MGFVGQGVWVDILGLIPSFGGLVQTVLAFVVALSVIVAVHEYGHYIVGRWTGIHADVFSLGFGPVIYTRTDKRGTRWQVAALPFGGYVKFAGDANAASAKDGAAMSGLTAAERRATMHGAPLWARAATVAAGPAFNFIMAIAIFAALMLARGVASDVPVIDAVQPLPALSEALHPGDRIVAMGGIDTPDTETFFAALDKLTPSASLPYVVERDGQTMRLEGPYPQPATVDSVSPGSAAEAAGMLAGDVIQTVDGTPIYAFVQLQERVKAAAGRPVALGIWRAGQDLTLSLTARETDLQNPDGTFERRYAIGVGGGGLVFDYASRTPGLLEALRGGVVQVWGIVTSTFSGLKSMIAGQISSCSISGPIGIAKTSGYAASLGAVSFVYFIAVLSAAVGLMNLFPVPVLDGGHLLFHAYEAVTRRPPSDAALRVMMGTGLVLLLGLMAFAISNDLLCP